MKKRLRNIFFMLLIIQNAGYAQLSGNYIISTSSPDGPNFNTLFSAITYVTAVGVNGPVTFLIDENQTGIASSITIGPISGSTATNTLTIKPNDGKNITIEGAIGGSTGSTKGLIELDNASHIILEGNNTVSDNNLTIYNSYNINDWAHSGAIWIKNGTNHCTIQNLTLRTTNRTIGTGDYFFAAGIYAGAEITSTPPAYTDPTHTDNINVHNVSFWDTKNPLYVNGDSTSSDWNITNCTISNLGPIGLQPVFGIVLFNINNYTISKNTIANVEKTTNNTIAACGISIRGTSSNGIISDNTIYNIRNDVENNSSYSAGINIFPAGGGSGGVSIYNNMISEITNAANLDNNDFNYHNKGHGIIIRGSNSSPIANGGNINIWHNSISINTILNGGRDACLYVEEYSNSTLDVRNNIFINNSPNGTQYSILIPGTNLPIISRMNYNTHYVNSFSPGYFRARFGGSESNDSTNPVSWHTATGDPETNAENVLNPNFVSNIDLHLQNIATNGDLSLGNSLIPPVNTDIDGDTRTKPYRGADEANICFQNAIWNGTAWSITPQSDSNLIFEGDYSENTDISGCNCTVNSPANVIIPDNKTMTIQDKVTVNAGGTLTFENNASLLQINDIANTGDIIYKRITKPMENFDYTYWSSPVEGQTTFDLSPNTLWDKYHAWQNEDWILHTGVMEKGVGYIIRTPKEGVWPAPYPETVVFPYSQQVQFIGTPNNGNVFAETTETDKYYLVGNPYPSAIDADLFIDANTNLEGVLYFWTHYTPIAPSGNKYVYTSNDYAVYSLVGGTATRGNFVDANNNGIADPGEIVSVNEPLGKIAAGQSFFAKGSGTGIITFSNSMRIKGENSQFFKFAKKTESAEKSRIWLNLTNTEGAFKQILLGYVEHATNDYDPKYDGTSFNGNQFIDFYSINQDKKYAIQGRAVPFNENDEIPLGYSANSAGEFTISIDRVDGILNTKNVYLEDKTTGTLFDLKNRVYTFNTTVGTFDDRFVLKYINQTLGNENPEKENNVVTVSVKNSIITVAAPDETIDTIIIYNLEGKKIFSKKNINLTHFEIKNFSNQNQVLFVKIETKNKQQFTKKILF